MRLCTNDYSGRTAFAYQEKKQGIKTSYSCLTDDIDALGSWLYKNGYKDCRIAIFWGNSYPGLFTAV